MSKYDIPFIDEVHELRDEETINRLKSVSHAKELPLQGYRQFGCINCEFRGTRMCDLKLPRNSKISFRELGINYDSICEKKYWYVLSMYQGSKTNPTYKELLSDYNKATQQDIIINIRKDIRKIEEKIEELEENVENLPEGTNEYYNSVDRISQLKKEHYIKTGLIFNSINQVEKVRQKDDEINIKSKLEVTQHKSISIQQLNILMNSQEQDKLE